MAFGISLLYSVRTAPVTGTVPKCNFLKALSFYSGLIEVHFS
jgi:hypothetical protein